MILDRKASRTISRSISRNTRNQSPPAQQKIIGGMIGKKRLGANLTPRTVNAKGESFLTEPNYLNITGADYAIISIRMSSFGHRQSASHAITSLRNLLPTNNNLFCFVRNDYYTPYYIATRQVFTAFFKGEPFPSETGDYGIRFSLPFVLATLMKASVNIYQNLSIERASSPLRQEEKNTCLFYTPEEKRGLNFIWSCERNGEHQTMTTNKKYRKFAKNLMACTTNTNVKRHVNRYESSVPEPALYRHAQLFYLSPLNTLEKLQLKQYGKTLSFKRG